MGQVWEEKDPSECCDTPDWEQENTVNDGDKVIVYSKCLNCRKRWKDVFRYSHSEVRQQTY